MKLRIAAVGRLRSGPEAALVSDYLERFNRTGRKLGLGPALIHEVEARKGGMAAEAALLERSLTGISRRVVLDERGERMTSVEFARMLGDWRDGGETEIGFAIGGADGTDTAFRAAADKSLSLGSMVWPHMLARVMLAEQLYRAATILAGTPYHRS